MAKDLYAFGDVAAGEAKVVWFDNEKGKMTHTTKSTKENSNVAYLNYMAINEAVKLAKNSQEKTLIHCNFKTVAFHLNRNWKIWNQNEINAGDRELCSYVQTQIAANKNIENVWFTNFSCNDSNDIFYSSYGRNFQITPSLSLADIRLSNKKTLNADPFASKTQAVSKAAPDNTDTAPIEEALNDYNNVMPF